MDTAEQLEQCVALIAHPDNLIQTIVFSLFFVASTVFAFMKKSMPEFASKIAKGIVNAVGKKK